MKRLLAYLFIVLGLGLMINISAKAENKNNIVVFCHGTGEYGHGLVFIKVLDFTKFNKTFVKKNLNSNFLWGVKNHKCKRAISEEHNKTLYNEAIKFFKKYSWYSTKYAIRIQQREARKFWKKYDAKFNFNNSIFQFDGNKNTFLANFPVKKEYEETQIAKVELSQKENSNYNWNGNTVSKKLYCYKAKEAGMPSYDRYKWEWLCGSDVNTQIAKVELSQKENSNYNWNGNTVSKKLYCYKAKEAGMPSYDRYKWEWLCGSDVNTQIANLEEQKQNSELAFCLSKIKESNAFVVRKLETDPCDGDNIIVTKNNIEDLNLFNNLKDRFETADGALIVTNEQINKFSSNKKIKLTSNKQKEFEPKDGEEDNDPPVIKIAKNITVKDSSYVIEGKLLDKSKKLFVEVDGKILPVKDGKFKIPRFSPINESVKIVAIDQWGNKSKPKIVNVKINIEETVVAENLEPLNPSNIRTKSSNEKIAIIIGIENYSEAPKANYANLDAQYFFDYARKAFGVKKQNINLLINENATIVKTDKALSLWLKSKVKKNRSDLIIFFAGHGLASTDGKELYLLPQDGNPDRLERTALSRTDLFKEIIELNPKSVTMFLDTCYSGVSRDEQMLLASARPIRIVADEQDGIPDNFTIFSASKLDQISSGLKEAKHGIFSYYLMKGLEGYADFNEDKKITNGELLAYMDENVSQKAAEQGREQNPSLAGDPDNVLMSYR